MKARNFIFSAFILFSSLFAGLANAVTVSVVPGKSVGLGDSYYWAGIVTLNIDGVEYPAMTTDWNVVLTDNPSEIIGTWETVLVTQSGIESSTTPATRFAPEDYRLAAQLFLYGMLGYYTDDPLWTAGHNEMVWNTFVGSPWDYGDRVYDPQTGITMHDVYLYNYLANGLDPNYDYSGFMMVLQANGTQPNEFLVYTGGPIVPVPPAVWLFGSGLIGLLAAARKQTAGMACGKMKAGCRPA